jgi:hypothetical protein
VSAAEVRRNERGAWCVYVRGNFISDHATRDGAVVAARQVDRIERHAFQQLGSTARGVNE